MTASANCAGFVLLMLGFRVRVRSWENFAKAKELGAVSSCQFSVPVTSIERSELSFRNESPYKSISPQYTGHPVLSQSSGRAGIDCLCYGPALTLSSCACR